MKIIILFFLVCLVCSFPFLRYNEAKAEVIQPELSNITLEHEYLTITYFEEIEHTIKLKIQEEWQKLRPVLKLNKQIKIKKFIKKPKISILSSPRKLRQKK